MVNVCCCASASVMIADSCVKMSSCPSAPTLWIEIPPSHTQQTEPTVEVEDSRWKVQTDASAPVCYCP